jgi:glycogen operon protein
MLSHGDELGRTQHGNNNAYCKDNAITWVDWAATDEDLLAFTRRLAQLRTQHPVFRRRRFFEGRPVQRRGDNLPDIAWLRPDGSEMTEQDWLVDFGRAVGIFLNGNAIPDTDDYGLPVTDDSFLLYLSAHHDGITFPLPSIEYGKSWELVVDTRLPEAEQPKAIFLAGADIEVGPRALLLLRRID